jgi:hypothetical protein
MPEANLFLLFTRPLNQLRARYVVTGSVAVILYGEPRLTHDVDIVLFLSADQMHRLPQYFPSADFYCPPAEVIQIEAAREQRGHFNLYHLSTGFKADIYFTGRDPLHAWAFRRARQVEVEGEPLWLAPPEYVIVRKLQFWREGGSEKHLRDIRSMLQISSGEIDRKELEDKIRELGLLPEWEQAQAKST